MNSTSLLTFDASGNDWAVAINEWFEQFERALNDWETWLTKVEQAMVLGEFPRLLELEEEGPSVHQALDSATNRRSQLLQIASQEDASVRGITDIVEMLFPNDIAKSNRLRLLSMQLQRVKSLSTSLFVTCLQSINYTQSMLQLISTGSPYSATYGQCELEAHGGGYIVDTAA